MDSKYELFFVIIIIHACIDLPYQVMGVTADGASVNRRLIRLHNPERKLVHKTDNPFVTSRPFLFICDPPHLIKTIRNKFSSAEEYARTH